MVEVRFYKDISSEYMIIQRQIEEGKSVFEEQLLHNNSPEGFAELTLKEEDGILWYYYDIRYRKSLSELSELGAMTYEEVRMLMKNIYQCFNRAEAYLLNTDSICFDERYVFKNMRLDHYDFIYIPGYRAGAGGQIKELLAWLMKHINYEDQKCVMYVFDLYRRLENGEDIFGEFKSENGTAYSGPADSSRLEWKKVSRTPGGGDHGAAVLEENGVVYMENTEGETGRDRDNVSDKNTELKPSGRMGMPIVVPAVSIMAFILSMLLGENLSYWFRMYTGFYPARMIWPLLVFAVGIIANAVIFLANIKRKENKEDFWDEDGKLDFKVMKENETMVLENKKEYPKTQLLNVNHLLLVGKSEDFSETIEITELPFTIGKNKEIVQYAIANSTVSRRHLQISFEKDRYYVSDLYSTNGTKINGNSLSPGKSYEIKPGDRLQIAAVLVEVQYSDMGKLESKTGAMPIFR